MISLMPKINNEAIDGREVYPSTSRSVSPPGCEGRRGLGGLVELHKRCTGFASTRHHCSAP